jgi:hypothetical protein
MRVIYIFELCDWYYAGPDSFAPLLIGTLLVSNIKLDRLTVTKVVAVKVLILL